MRTWVRRPMQVKCGRCGELVPKNSPILLIDPTPERAVKHRFIRCALCAGEPVPADVPTMEPVRLKVPVRLGVVVPFDFKSAAAGRDPGEDD